MSKKIFSALILIIATISVWQIHGQSNPAPSCNLCPAEYISVDEIYRYATAGREIRPADMQIRSIDIGRSNVQVALAHRNSLDERAGRVAVHNLVTEVYYVLSGGATILTGPELIDSVARPSGSFSVMNLNGPGQTARDVRNGAVQQLSEGDVMVIPAGTGHEFIEIPDHITYLMVRVDPDKVVPLMNVEDSMRFLAFTFGEL